MTTKAKNDDIMSGLELLSTVAKTWWTIPNAAISNVPEAPVRQLTEYASDLQQIYADTFSRHRDLLFQATTELSRWTPALMQVGQPQGAMEASLKMMTSMLEASLQSAALWTDMSRQIGARNASLAHQLAQDITRSRTVPPASAPEDTPVPGRKKAK